MKEVVIVPTGGTNFASVEDALERIGCRFFYAKNQSDILNASKILLPGVGSMQNAQIEMISEVIEKITQPVLGICLGMQVLFESSQECTAKKGLGVFKKEVVKFGEDVVCPHTGWNELIFEPSQSIFEKCGSGHVYFTHSFFVPKFENTIAFCEYGKNKVSGIVNRENFYGFQFHPERSGLYGQRLLEAFFDL